MYGRILPMDALPFRAASGAFNSVSQNTWHISAVSSPYDKQTGPPRPTLCWSRYSNVLLKPQGSNMGICDDKQTVTKAH